MLIVLAWRNIWRNKKRSLIILAAITFGLWGGLFSSAVMMGMGESAIVTAIERDLTHIQIHDPRFPLDREIQYSIPDASRMIAQVEKLQGVKAVSGRTLIEGMAASPTSNSGVRIVGIIPGEAAKATQLPAKIIAGTFFQSDHKNPIVIGQKLAEQLNLKLNSKIVLSFQGTDGSIIYHACRIVGIFKTEAALFDGLNVFVKQPDLFKVLNSPPMIHEIAILAESSKAMVPIYATLKSHYPELLIQTWQEIAPETAFLSDVIVIFSYIFVGIILFALLFGITNTMLMSVIDRIREIGMLVAVGMKKSNVFLMILLETIFLSITGGAAGILVGFLSIAYFRVYGIDLTAFSRVMANFGMSAVLFPYLPVIMYIVITFMIIVAANCAAIFPAIKAVKIEPSEALRTY